MEAAAVESVVYSRGVAVISDAMAATLSAPEVQQITGNGAAVVGREFTWRLKREDLVLEGAPLLPKKDDRIDWVWNGITYTFVVMPEVGRPELKAVDQRNEWVPVTAKLIGM